MALRPLGNTLFGEVIEHDDHSEIRDEVQEVLGSSDFLPAYESRKANRRLLAPLEAPKKQHYQVEVIAVGPECREIVPGDIAILPKDGGTMVTVIDEETHTYRRVFCITEDVVLAVFTED